MTSVFHLSSASDVFVVGEVLGLRKWDVFYSCSTQYNFPLQVLIFWFGLETQCLCVYSEAKYSTRNIVCMYDFIDIIYLKIICSVSPVSYLFLLNRVNKLNHHARYCT